MATVKDAITKIWVEDLAPGVKTALLKLDKTFANIRDSATATSANMGRDWKVKHTYVTSLAGKIVAYNTTGEGAIYGAGTDPVIRVNGTAPATFPTLDGTPQPGYMQTELTLARWKGNTFLPSQYLRADQLESLIDSPVGTILKQTALGIATVKANQFFATDSFRSFGSIGAITGTHAGGTEGNTDDVTVKFTLGTADRIRKFQPGLEVDIYDATGATKRNGNGACYVKVVDPINNEVTISHSDGAAVFSSQCVATDIVVLKDSKAAGPAAMDDFLLASGTISPLSLSVDTNPTFKSVVVANLGGALTEADLRKYVGGFIDIYGTSMAPDTLLTTQGVLNAYVAETDDMWQFGIQGQPLRKEGGFELGGYNYDGTSMKFQISPLMKKGNLRGVRLANNWKRYVPPRLPKAGSNKFFNNDIEFVAPLGGAQGIWLFVTYNDQITDWSQAPYECVEQYAPEQIQGIKIGGITEEIAVS